VLEIWENLNLMSFQTDFIQKPFVKKKIFALTKGDLQ